MSICQALLKDGHINSDSFGIDKYPFASMFFLREGNDDAGNEQFFAHYYTDSENKKYRAGEEVRREKYQFNFYVNDQLIESVTDPGKRFFRSPTNEDT